MTDFDLIAMEIGRKGELTFADNEAAVVAFLRLIREHPEAEKHIMIGGYDDDPREVWDIPEAKHYISLFVDRVYQAHQTRFDDWRLDNESTAVVAMCIGAGKIVSTDPVTGIHDVRITLPG